MTARPPLSRPVQVANLPPEGRAVEVVARDEERAALARDFDLQALHRLEGRFQLTPLSRGRVQVEGAVEAEVVQTCVVTLEPLDASVSEPVEVLYSPEEEHDLEAKEVDLSTFDPPDLIVGGAIDLGALTAEFLALGLDPYPRKPGAPLDESASPTAPPESPFAALARLRGGGDR